MKLLRARHAPMILSFLYQEFKLPNRITIPNYQLVDRLADYLEAINFHDDEQVEPEPSVVIDIKQCANRKKAAKKARF